jgi:predicted N-acetyltransferase YhbS
VIEIREETVRDAEPRESVLDVCFGASRFEKTCERLREGRRPAEGLSLVAAHDGAVVATVRLWYVTAGTGRPALMLGPLAVDPSHRRLGFGAKLMREALSRAMALGHEAVLLVGDAPYYGRFGFSVAKTGGLWMPGPYERHRLLAVELVPGALDGARGPISPTGALEERPDLAALAAAAAQGAFGMGRAA